jgi:hypothetical protein
VLTDGVLLEQRHGRNVYEISNDYISDTTLLRMAANEMLRLLSRPQDQMRGVKIRPSPPIQLEDVAQIIEPESGVNMRFVILGLTQAVAGGSASARAETEIDVLALPVTSTAGLGQTPNPDPTQSGPVPD